MSHTITIVGGGLAGSEAAWAAASRGARVVLHEMRPERATAVHRTAYLAELVCSNSLKSDSLANASGVLKAEMRRLGSVILTAAEFARVPAGEALAVDPELFAAEVTRALEEHPNVTVRRGEVTDLPPDRPVVLATGPLTAPDMAACIDRLTGGNALAFYDAVAPTVTLESLDLSRLFRASRRGRSLRGPEPDPPGCGAEEPDGDYLNCPLTREQYAAFREALAAAEVAEGHNPEDRETPYFEACVPVEELARRGERTLAFGPMRPVGLADPATGKRPHAVVQLRQENRAGTLWGLVGFQTRLKWPEQRRVFRMLPGLEQAEFVRYGVMHRNTYVNAPLVLTPHLQLAAHHGVYLAGQVTGVEGYLESAATGLLAGVNALRSARGLGPAVPPEQTVLGSLVRYLVETDPRRFAPMNANFGIVPELETRVRDKREKARLKAERALAALEGFASEVDPDP